MVNILNYGDNVDGQEDYGFRGSYFRKASSVIDDYTKNKCLNMQLENLIPNRDIKDDNKQSDERYQINMIYYK